MIVNGQTNTYRTIRTAIFTKVFGISTGYRLTYPADLRYLGDITAPFTTNPYRHGLWTKRTNGEYRRLFASVK